MVQKFTVYFWKAKHIYYETTRLLPKETEGGLDYFNFESDLFLYVFDCSANSLSMFFYFQFFLHFFDAFCTPHCAFYRRSLCNRTVNTIHNCVPLVISRVCRQNVFHFSGKTTVPAEVAASIDNGQHDKTVILQICPDNK